MRLVVDASIVLRWVLEDERSVEADALLDRILLGQDEAVIPPHARAECYSGLTRIVFRESHRLTAVTAGDLLNTLEALPLLIVEPAGLYGRSLAEVVKRGLHPSMAYDMIYLALAEMLDVPLWTGDARFYHAIQPASPRMSLVPSIRSRLDE